MAPTPSREELSPPSRKPGPRRSGSTSPRLDLRVTRRRLEPDRTHRIVASRLLEGAPDPQRHGVIEPANQDLKPHGQALGEVPHGHRQAREVEEVYEAAIERQRRAFVDIRQWRGGRLADRRDDGIEPVEERLEVDLVGTAAIEQPDIGIGRDIASPRPIRARMTGPTGLASSSMISAIRVAFGAHDVAGIPEIIADPARKPDFLDPGTKILERARGLPTLEQASHIRGELGHLFGGQAADPQALDAKFEAFEDVERPAAAGFLVALVETLHRIDEEGRIPDRSGERTDGVEGRG